MKAIAIDYNEYTTEELLKMKKSKAVEGLDEKKQRFCEYYVEGHNRKTALLKAGYTFNDSNMFAYRLFQNKNIQRYICWLKARITHSHMINAYDVLDEWIRIAFSDITDFVNVHPHSISLKPSEQMDGQLVKSIKSGRDGISIELYDKMRALDCLARYMDDLPSDWKQKIEERKLELLEQEFELKKQAMVSNSEKEDDGFLDAVKKSAEAVWDIE